MKAVRSRVKAAGPVESKRSMKEKTEEENNGYVVFDCNINGSAEE
jgi:hypothetical protein